MPLVQPSIRIGCSLEKQYGKTTRIVTCAALSLVFLVRAGLYLMTALIGHNPVNSAKAGFYRRACGRLLWNNATKVPSHDGESFS